MPTLPYLYSNTVIAGTLKTGPVTFDLTTRHESIGRIEVDIPHGCADQAGWQLWYGGAQAFPYNVGEWYAGDGQTYTFEPDPSMTSGSWQLVAYNIGFYDHTLTVRLYQEQASAAPVYIGQQPQYIPPVQVA